MEIKATTTYSYEIYKEYTKFSMYKGKTYIKWLFLTTIVLGTILSLYGFINDDDTTISLVFMILIILMVVIMIFSSCILPKIMYKSMKNISDIKNEFIFKDDEFSTVSSSLQFNGNSTTKYEMLYKVYETPKYFYIYINKAQAYIVNKSEIIDGTAEQIRDSFLKHLTHKQYIICK